MSTDFSSIDRLVELGMGMNLAQQMVNTMNQTMNTMQVAGVNAGTTGQRQMPMHANGCTQWYVVVDDKQAGPLTDADIAALVKAGKISDNTLAWCPGMPAWQMACNIPAINKIFLLKS